MKTVFFCLVLVSAASVFADNPSLNGKWKVHNSISGNESDMECTLTQKDDVLTGTCTTEQGAATINGKVDGKKVNWVFKSEYNGSPITLTYKGTLEAADKVSGTVNVEEYSVEGDFTATLAK